MDARGCCPVPENERLPTRVRTPQSDVVWLRTAIHHAMRRRVAPGRFLMTQDPTRGFRAPSERNPRRPVMTAEHHEALLAVAEEVHPYLRTLLIVARGTGRRISAILGLRARDLALTPTATCPDGAIRWPADTDKMGKEWDAPITRAVRDELATRLEIARLTGGGTPDALLFPAPGDASVAVTKDLAGKWLRRAERLAKLERVPGLGWHAYRRAWATVRKGLPDVDVAAAGGWSDTRALKTAYQRPDPATLLRVVAEPAELREVR